MKADPNAEMKQFIAEQFLEFSRLFDKKLEANTAILRQEMADMEKRLDTRITIEVNAMGVRLMAEIDEVSENVHQMSLNMGLLERRLTKRFEKKIDDLSASIADAFETNHEHYDTWLKDHELRLGHLETQTA